MINRNNSKNTYNDIRQSRHLPGLCRNKIRKAVAKSQNLRLLHLTGKVENFRSILIYSM